MGLKYSYIVLSLWPLNRGTISTTTFSISSGFLRYESYKPIILVEQSNTEFFEVTEYWNLIKQLSSNVFTKLILINLISF